jgi:hypothetical protein
MESRSVILDGTKTNDTFDLQLPTRGTYDVTLSSFTSDKSADEKSLIWKNRTGQPFTPAWTPDQIQGLNFWLDASDVSSLLLTGDNVDGWIDKVNSVVGDAPAANRPSYDATANGGRGAVVFDQSGADKEWLNFGDILKSTNATGLTIMGVFQSTKTPLANEFPAFFGKTAGANASNQWNLFKTNVNLVFSYRGSSTDVYNSSQNFTDTSNFNVLGGIYEPNTITSFVNSTSPSPLDVTVNSATASTTNVIMGANSAFSSFSFHDMSACEILAFLRPLSTFERQVVEGYLAHKWGTAQFLPANHPYKLTPPGYIEDLRDITYAPSLGLFAAVANTGVGNRMMTSPDGITWTTRTIENNNYVAITWSEEVGAFVAVSNNGANRVQRSTDGITWTPQTIDTTNWADVIYAKQLARFYAISNTGTSRVSSSPDGITWTTLSTPTNTTWRGIAYSPTLGSGQGRLVAVGNSTVDERTMYSDDAGANWTISASLTSAKVWLSLDWSPTLSRFALVNNNTDDEFAYSDDGITWTVVTAPFTSRIGRVKWIDELNIFMSSNTHTLSGNHSVVYSSDGVTWDLSIVPTESGNRSLAYGAGKVVIVGPLGTIATSFTGREQRLISLQMDELNTGDGRPDVLISDTANHNIVNVHYARTFLNGRLHYKITDDDGFPINRRFVLNFDIQHIEKK